MSPSSLALSNLRAIVILIVLGFHSMLAYLVWVPIAAATDFVSPPYAWRSFPIIDDHRFFGFDLICAWQDVYLMALMFFLSGLFVWPSLMRKNDWGFCATACFGSDCLSYSASLSSFRSRSIRRTA
jgi:glucans biosynthesis protein C